MAVVEGVGVQVHLIDWEIGRVLKAQEHDRLTQNANQVRQRIEDVQR